MDAVFKKLNYKGQQIVYSINHPKFFEVNLNSLIEADIKIEASKAKEIEFVIVFVLTQAEVNKYVKQIAPKLKDNAVFWMCYPKGTSKKYKCDFNRDTGWQIMGDYDLEGVRMVAIDEDWSAMRFRKVEYIKSMTRKFDALSAAGKEKTGQKKNKKG